MPTAAEHRSEALSLEWSIRALDGVRSVLTGHREHLGFSGGVVAPLLHRALEASDANVGQVARQCWALIDELHRRARLCDEYTAQVRAYEIAHASWSEAHAAWWSSRHFFNPSPWPGFEPTPPPPPFEGAEAG